LLKHDLFKAEAKDDPCTILCLGAHADDIEIGCGGTVIKLLEAYKKASVYWAVFSSEGARAEEARNSAAAFLELAHSKNVVLHNFRNGFFPYEGSDIKECFEGIKSQFSPDLILTHYRHDLHQDHRLLAELTWNTFRDHLIWEYEIPKYDGDFGSPNVFIHLDDSIVRRKLNLIFDNFHSQQDKDWFDRDTFLAVLRIRGVESHSPSRYAEAFYCRKMVFV
jgi:LmbE family N-acetylglucosaminyl deacetylase